MNNRIRIEKRQIKINKSKVTVIQTKNGKVQVWSEKQDIDEDETRALLKLTKLKHVHEHIAILPDFHISGILMNGAVIATRDYIYLNAIGGDIGCGMASLMLPINIEAIAGKEEELYKDLYNSIPTGRRTRSQVPLFIEENELFKNKTELLTHKVVKKLQQQLGTVGDGNHFLEIQKNDTGQLHLLVHTGSRYLGQLIKEFYMKNVSEMQNNVLYAVKADSEIGTKYMNDHDFALQYAKENRKEILRSALEVIKTLLKLSDKVEDLLKLIIDVPHNYISEEEFSGERLFIHRKGAQRVENGSLGIIPGDMSNASYLVEGKGYELTYNSCSHGAGRKISRGKALYTVDYEVFLNSVKDIVCRTDRNILDEAPQAYKDIEQVLKYQKEIVRIVDVFKPIINIKG